MQGNRETERHYRVVRYYADFRAGPMQDVIADELTLEEARKLAAEHRGEVPGEDIVIQDQDKKGVEAEIVF